jgi:antitoxin component of MazEF toxin-antitoxin module
MSRVFQGKLRRVGNSLAVIVPKEVLEDVGVEEGDNVKVSIAHKEDLSKKGKKIDLFESVAGIYPNAKSFVRDRNDRAF